MKVRQCPGAFRCGAGGPSEKCSPDPYKKQDLTPPTPGRIAPFEDHGHALVIGNDPVLQVDQLGVQSFEGFLVLLALDRFH